MNDQYDQVRMPEHKVVLFSQPGCQLCRTEKGWLAQRGVPFAERDIVADETAYAELERRGVLSTPVTLIDGEAVLGFDPKKLTSLLGLSR